MAIPQLDFSFLKRPETVATTRSIQDSLALLERKEVPHGLGKGLLSGHMQMTLEVWMKGDDLDGDPREWPRSVPIDGVGKKQLGEVMKLKAEDLMRQYINDSQVEKIQLKGERGGFLNFRGFKVEGERRTPVDLQRFTMRRLHMAMDGLPQEWEKDDGMCVWNALDHLYNNELSRMKRYFNRGPDHFFDQMTKLYHKTADFLDEDDDYDPQYNAKKHGVSPYLLMEGFCKPHNIPCHVMDANGMCVYSFEPAERHRHAHTLCFRVQGNHIYLDPAKARSLAKALNSTVPKMPSFGKRDGVKHGDDAVTQAKAPEYVVLDGDDGTDGYLQLRKAIEEHDCAPQGWKVTLANDKVVGWSLGDKQYLVNGSSIQKAQQLMKNMGRTWEGHTVSGVLHMLVEEVFGSKGLPRLQPNPEARDVLLAPGIMAKAQCGLTEAGQLVKDELDAMVKDGRAVVYDQSKSHGNSLYNPEEPWYNTGPHDCVIDIDEDSQSSFDPVQPGLYYCNVHEDGHALFRRGTGWYCRALVKDARRRKLKFDVLHHLQCSVTHGPELFRPLLERFVEVSEGDPELYKTLITHLSGYLGKTRMECCTMYIDSDPRMVWSNYCKQVNTYDMMAPRCIASDAKGKVIKQPRGCEHPEAIPVPPVSLSDPNACHKCHAQLGEAYYALDGLGYCDDCVSCATRDCVDCVVPEESKQYFLYGTKRITQLTELSVVQYLQVLDFQSMRQARMEDQLGEIYLRKTDCVVAAPGKQPIRQPPFCHCPHKDAKVRAAIATWGKYRQCTNAPQVRSRLAPSAVPAPKHRKWFHYHHICNSNQFKDVLDIVMSQGRVLINGGPGTGKTWMGLKVGAMLEKLGLRVCYTAFTNMAAMNVDGCTIDRALGLKSDEDGDDNDTCFFSHKWIKALRRFDVFIVDEVSLIPGPRLAALEAVAQFFPAAKFILIGDRDQCGYVEPGAKHQAEWYDYFDHPTMLALAGGNWVNLVVRHRSKCPKLDDTMDRLREGKGLELRDVARGCMPLSMSYTNRVRNRVNQYQNHKYYKLAKARGQAFKWLPATKDGKDMYLFKGVPLQANDTKKTGFVLDGKQQEAPHGRVFPARNELFKVHSIRGRWVTLETQRRRKIPGTIEFEHYPYFIVVAISAVQRWFKLAYCITVHSSQGCTFTEPFTIWESGRMERRILYTAVGRAQRLEQVHLPPPELRHLERVDEAKEARDLHFIKHRLDC